MGEVDSALRDAFPTGTLERDGAVIGAWFPAGFVTANDEVGEWLGFRAAWIDPDGRAAHATSRFPADAVRDGPAAWAAGLTSLRKGDPGTSPGFGEALRELDGLSRDWPDMADNLDHALRAVARRIDPKGAKAAARDRRAAISAAVAPFPSHLDHDAAKAAEAAYGAGGLDDCWDGYAATAFPDRPLAAAAARWPMLARTLLDAWVVDRGAFVAHPGDRGWLESARERLRATSAIAPRCLDALEGAHDAFARRRAAMTPSERSVDDSFGPRDRRDRTVAALAWLSLAPADAVPSDDEWDAFVRCSHVLRHALSHAGLREGDGPQDGFLLGDATWPGWDAWTAGLAESAGLSAAAGEEPVDALLDALRASRDVADAYADQVVVPSLLLAGGHGREHRPAPGWADRVGAAALAATWSGTDVRSVLAASAAWHDADGTIDAVRVGLPGGDGIAPSWGACLPDHAEGGLSLRILRDGRALALAGACEGGRDGMAGMSREARTTTGECLRGNVRVGVVSRVSHVGSSEPLSTVTFLLGDDRMRVGEHRSMAGGAPTRECEAFVARYATMAGEPGVARWVERWDTLGGADGVTGAAGYAWWEPANLDAMERAWRPHAPSWAHGLGPDGWAAVLAGYGLAPGSRAARTDLAPSPER